MKGRKNKSQTFHEYHKWGNMQDGRTKITVQISASLSVSLEESGSNGWRIDEWVGASMDFLLNETVNVR